MIKFHGSVHVSQIIQEGRRSEYQALCQGGALAGEKTWFTYLNKGENMNTQAISMLAAARQSVLQNEDNSIGSFLAALILRFFRKTLTIHHTEI